MDERFQNLRERFDRIEDEVERALEKRRAALRYRLQKGKAIFEREALEAHRAIKKSALRSLADAYLRNLIAAPFIYAVVLPLAALDIVATLYQNVAFRLWRIPVVSRKAYVVIDRHRLAYLNWIQKLNCVYCGYANGVLGYVSEIASRTERYWCPIKHAVRVKNAHSRYLEFSDYGEADNVDAMYKRHRESLREESADRDDQH